MPHEKITVVARFKAKTDRVEQAKRELLALVPLTRGEPGCLNYDLHQDPHDKTLFLFYENWATPDDLDRHLKKPYLEALRDMADHLFTEPIQIERWKMIS